MLTSGASGRVSALFSAKTVKSWAAYVCAVLSLLLMPFRFRRSAVVSSGAAMGEKGREERSEGNRKNVMVPASAIPLRVAVSAVLDQEVAARRALAKKRVIQDEDEVTDREYMLFTTPKGDTLFTQTWIPVGRKIRGVVVLLHGLNEHSARYSDFAKKLNANGFKVYGMDWIGKIKLLFSSILVIEEARKLHSLFEMLYAHHFTERMSMHSRSMTRMFHVPGLAGQKPLHICHGGSDGLHAYVHSLNEVVNDLKLYLEKVKAQNPGVQCFCFGHSTGGAIILKAMLDPKVEAGISGVVLTSPAVGVQPSHPIYTIVAPIVAFLLPKHQISAANKPGMPVSRDPDALVAKYSDPLVYTGHIRVRTGYEILRIAAHIQQNTKRLRVPFLVLHGTADSVTDPEGSVKLFEGASSADKTIRLLEGHVHDLLFEPELDREAVAQDIIKWLTLRLAQ
ncbi:hypothetical protein MLD38_021760 [Melastoma candidum]|uniref:Uncharacterized protein n=1 Tax=Melastoma candidum TaxID=119954 RepID=A0ACB9QGG4_9MYRT|nr:hypothetical protein MLD38_021760 [Melastoma candidum]